MGFRIGHKISAFFRLSATDRHLLMVVFWLLLTVDLRIRFRGWNMTYKYMQAKAIAHTKPRVVYADEAYRVRQIASIVRLINKYIPYITCLRSSLVIWYLLQCDNIDSVVQIGARYAEDGQFEAHAWTEYKGMPIFEKDGIDKKYVPFNKPLV